MAKKTVTQEQMKQIQKIYEDAHEKLRSLRIKRVKIVENAAMRRDQQQLESVRSKIASL